MGIDEYVRSPTFVLVSIHQGKLPLYHIDIYRLDEVAEVVDLGLEEYLAGDGVSVIEWASKALEVFPKPYMLVTLDLRGRKRAHSSGWSRWVSGTRVSSPGRRAAEQDYCVPEKEPGIVMELSIDTSTRYAAVGLSRDGKLLAEYSWVSRQNHSVELLPAIDKLLKSNGAAPRDLTCAFVAIGPGGFSALRVGLSTAKGLAISLGIPLVAVNTLEIEAEPYRSMEMPVCAVLDAGRSEVSAAMYADEDGQWKDRAGRPRSLNRGAVLRGRLGYDLLLRRGAAPGGRNACSRVLATKRSSPTRRRRRAARGRWRGWAMSGSPLAIWPTCPLLSPSTSGSRPSLSRGLPVSYKQLNQSLHRRHP